MDILVIYFVKQKYKMDPNCLNNVDIAIQNSFLTGIPFRVVTLCEDEVLSQVYLMKTGLAKTVHAGCFYDCNENMRNIIYGSFFSFSYYAML